ncbi:MAG: hypothetical protein IJ661_06175 [Lachnospiraceae bacterium]|nr:hypothetical protein [Lachnospiraceae bacterium]
MTINKGILSSDIFYIDNLDINAEDDIKAIQEFQINAPEGLGLSIYLKEDSCNEEIAHEMRTYLVRLLKTGECVGYFSLKAGLVSLNEIEVEIIDDTTGEKRVEKEFDTLPGVELANFAVNSAFIAKYPFLKGVGYVIFKKFIIPMINEAAKYIGIKVVYIFALPYERLINRYQRYGFRRLPEMEESILHKRLKPRYDESCKFMYLLLT